MAVQNVGPRTRQEEVSHCRAGLIPIRLLISGPCRVLDPGYYNKASTLTEVDDLAALMVASVW